ncbi:hypothetical protein R1sor_001281 [Riccia sorocarpa]|uniref:Reverse transcriptase domain-containing protein n=1 Tax=Riccia sorocarpa TaxID=122646 RepID=A0ABD3GZG2_9MARC
MNELMADPQSFWKRLQVRRPKTILNESDLLEYIKQLYFFIDAGQMPFTVGGGCVFTVEEVGREIGRMKVGRAADIAGLTVELLKWCGPITLNAVTQLLTRACKDGLPVSWTYHKVVPLYKNGPKHDPGSYRTIMVASVFAKVIGRLLEARLNQWSEEAGVRAPGQAGFRKDHCAMDHALVLRVLAERARRTKRPLYVLFVDFKKAFDSVPRDLIWQRLRLIGVPNDLVNSIAALYHQVVVKVGDSTSDVNSTLGVIQGCSLSPTLFGIYIDSLFWQLAWEDTAGGDGLQVHTLIFTNDVAILAEDADQLQKHLQQLEAFCAQSQMSVNLTKSLWLKIGKNLGEEFRFQCQLLEKCDSYKYLGLEFRSNLSWKDYSVLYTLLLAEVGKIPLEAEGLLLAIRYVQRIKKHDRERYTYLALSESRVHGWFGDVCPWGNRWGFPEDMWSETGSLRENLTKAIVRTLWCELSPRQAYYLRDVSKLDPYDEKPYLTATISPRIRRLISRYRTSSHDLRVEVGRWSRLPGSSVLALCVRWRKWKTNTIHCLSVHDM